MKTSTPTSTFVCLSLAASALGMGISYPNEANAQVVDAPPHRVEFTVSPDLPKCSDYDAFYGILVNWVRVRSLDPTAKRRLIVDIKRLPDGIKRVKLSVLDPEGAEVGAETHPYSSTEECFKVLYWTAFDASKLLRSTIPPPVEEPPMSVDKLVEAANKPDQVSEKRTKRSTTVPIYDAEFYSDPKSSRQQCEAQDKPRLPGHTVFGVGATLGLTRMIMPGLRIGVGRTFGPIMFELDARAFPPLISAEWDTEARRQISGSAQAYLGAFAACAHRKPLIGCAVVMGGVAGHSYDEPVLDAERYSNAQMGGIFGLGMRAGAELALSDRWALRVDAEVSFPIYMAESLRPKTRFGEELVGPVWTGFVSVVPSF